jgi:hypothetical protein
MQKGILMKFARVFDVARYGQIVMIKKQNDEGAPELRFFCHPEGFGVCSFAIGWNDDEEAEKKMDEAFSRMVMREAIEICDGYFKHMASMEQKH